MSKNSPLHVPLGPVLGALTLYWAILLDVAIIVGMCFGRQGWPAPIKVWICNILVIICHSYLHTIGKRHEKYFVDILYATLTYAQMIVIVLFVILWVALALWIWQGPPSPAFQMR